MGRKRMIHPDFFTSGTMNDLSIPTMLTFAGVWVWADDYGRGEDDPALVKAAVWPRRRAMTETKVAAALDELVEAGVMCRYTVSGHPLLHVTNWAEHQKVSHPTASKLPPCPLHEPAAHDEFLASADPALERFRRVSRIARERLQDSVVEVSSGQFSAGVEDSPHHESSPSDAREQRPPLRAVPGSGDAS